ncbi:Trehalose 6-phosphate phosphatase [Plasmodiophora brassicae]|nr:hypothetical protein PBRA_003065 [Plasmodiophora brassicae]
MPYSKSALVFTTTLAVVGGAATLASNWWSSHRKPALEDAAVEPPQQSLSMTTALDGVWIPHAISHWSTIQRSLDGKTIGIFLDYDGTLTPIVNNPQDALLSERMREGLRRLASIHETVIVTGRGLTTIRDFVQMDNIYYAASHGFDIFGPNGTSIEQVGLDVLPILESLFEDLQRRLRAVRGCLVENNKFSLAVHYRNVAPDDRRLVEMTVTEAIAPLSDHVKRTSGKLVWEIRPRKDWHKGAAVERIASRVFGDTPVVPIYIGDDTTDEDAFKVVRARGGVSILVSSVVRDTSASYFVKDTEDVYRVLCLLCEVPPVSNRSA